MEMKPETISAPREVVCPRCREPIKQGETATFDTDRRLIHLNGCKKLWVPR